MKKILLLSLLILFGCSKEEDNSNLIDSYISQINSLNSQLSQSKSQISSLQNQVNAIPGLEETISQLNTQISELQNNINSLTNQVNTIPGLEETISQLNTQISELQNNINSLTNQVNTIPGLEETISQLNTQISELQSTINSLSNDVNIIPSNFTLSSNYIAPDTFYNIKLNWDINENPIINSINIYKGDRPDNLTLYKIVYDLNGEYTDTQVSVRKNYYYSLSYNYLEVESDKTEVRSIEPFEPENNLTAPTNFPMPRGIHYAYQYFDKNTFESVKHTFTIHQEPSNNGRLYYQFYNGRINDDIGFYYGIQTDVYSPEPPYWRGRGLIFSRWKTRDINNYSLAPNGWGQSAGYEGDFIGVRNSYNWEVGTYETEFKKDSSDNIGDWYSLKIRNVLENEQTYIGSIRFEKSSVSSGIKSGGSLWTELYSNAADGSIPDWHVSVDDILIDNNEKPDRIYTTYNETFEDFSNIYTTNKNDVHFLVGPKVKKITPKGWFYWNED